eukprot:3285931-Rhodomonas_salina.1
MIGIDCPESEFRSWLHTTCCVVSELKNQKIPKAADHWQTAKLTGTLSLKVQVAETPGQGSFKDQLERNNLRLGV